MQVLLIEDNPSLRRLYAKTLRHQLYTVTEAGTYDEALAALATLTPDLALIDMEIPGGNGRMIIDHMKRDSRLKATTIMVITGESKYETLGNFGADMFLLKPVSTRLLQAFVAQAAQLTPL
jgi:CheY-like chemotaxis protein